jgi:hypothetical protein
MTDAIKKQRHICFSKQSAFVGREVRVTRAQGAHA